MAEKINRLGLVFFPAFDWAISPTHPEREERLLYTRDQIEEEGLLDLEQIVEYNPLLCNQQDLKQVHIPVAEVSRPHRISAGGAITAGRAVLKGEVDKAFAIVRPPGHHARRIVHGVRGFCLINSEAVMVEKLRKEFGIKKVAIIDTDCHHGDGTQDIYRNDPDTLFISMHQDGRTLYPGSGFTNELGGPGARGYTLNIPLPPLTSDQGYLYLIKHLVKPVLEEFKPELIINSAGQDNHYSDPLTNMNLTAQGYAELTSILDPDISILEGGYAIEDALPYVNTGLILALTGLDYSGIIEPGIQRELLTESSRTMDRIKTICEQVYHSWQHKGEIPLDHFGQDVDAGRIVHSGQSDYLVEERTVFYDTAGILEKQQEQTILCSDCPGFVQLESKADNGISLTAILLPRKACSQCRAEAYNLFDRLEPGFKRLVFLQDRENEHFAVKRG